MYIKITQVNNSLGTVDVNIIRIDQICEIKFSHGQKNDIEDESSGTNDFVEILYKGSGERLNISTAEPTTFAIIINDPRSRKKFSDLKLIAKSVGEFEQVYSGAIARGIADAVQ